MQSLNTDMYFSLTYLMQIFIKITKLVNIITMSDTLLLNTSGQPISSFPVSTINWQRAVKLFWLDKVTVLEWYDD